jgi:hypothetical protein
VVPTARKIMSTPNSGKRSFALSNVPDARSSGVYFMRAPARKRQRLLPQVTASQPQNGVTSLFTFTHDMHLNLPQPRQNAAASRDALPDPFDEAVAPMDPLPCPESVNKRDERIPRPTTGQSGKVCRSSHRRLLLIRRLNRGKTK